MLQQRTVRSHDLIEALKASLSDAVRKLSRHGPVLAEQELPPVRTCPEGLLDWPRY
jgi:hypothetical protein